jgi:hypothetical protein
MRTTVELPPELMRAAKARSAERGETFKTLLTRAIETELAMPGINRKPAGRVQLPLIPGSKGPKVHITNELLEDVIAADDAAAFRALIKENRPSAPVSPVKLLDVNVWIAACYPDHPHHDIARRWIDDVDDRWRSAA